MLVDRAIAWRRGALSRRRHRARRGHLERRTGAGHDRACPGDRARAVHDHGRPAPRRGVPAAAPAPKGAAAAKQPAGQKSNARDEITLDPTQITGNKELPNVMYVVPWKRPDIGDMNGRPPKSLIDEALAPVDRDVFRRQNRYFAASAVPDCAPHPSSRQWRRRLAQRLHCRTGMRSRSWVNVKSWSLIS